MRTRQRLIEILPTINLPETLIYSQGTWSGCNRARAFIRILVNSLERREETPLFHNVVVWRKMFKSEHVQELIDESIHYLTHPEE